MINEHMRAELRALDADALYERTKLLLRISRCDEVSGLDRDDRDWRNALESEWARRGRRETFARACREINDERLAEQLLNRR